jgi:succinylglutamate desuccinylase
MLPQTLHKLWNSKIFNFFHAPVGACGGARWLRHCNTSWKVGGSIPDGITGIFHSLNPFGCTMALGSTQPLTEMSIMNISWTVKALAA